MKRGQKMAKSKKYDTVKKWWENWHKVYMVEDAVVKGWITQEEAEEIMAGGE